jgi:arsenate reductase
MTITLHGLKNCDTCKKALAELKAAGKDVEFKDIRTETDLAKQLPRWASDLGAEALVNRRSTTWRQLSDDQKGRAETDPLPLLQTTPTLIKRPVIEDGDGTTVVGWTDKVKAGLGLDA